MDCGALMSFLMTVCFRLQIVFVNLREDIFTRLYRWHVSEARLAPVLARMNQLLGDIVSQVRPPPPPC